MRDAERHGRVQHLFDAVCDLSASERDGILAACEDPAVAAEVRALVAADGKAAPLERPAVERIGEPAGRHDSLQVPEMIGEYRILGVLGEGGMGIVYEALQASPSRSVALKLIKAGFIGPEQLRRFRREAEVLALLEHPLIARIYAAGTTAFSGGERPYISMELVRGETIVDYADARELDVPGRLRLISQVLEAVSYAHGQGVVHRDLKPANVLVTQDGVVKILDFGVARITDPDSSLMTSATRAGELLGTLPYMSPEQLVTEEGGAAVDMRSDVYSVGVMAYRLLAGKLPLDVGRRSLAEAARIITEEDPTSLAIIDPQLRGDVAWMVQTALAKDRSERYVSAAAFRSDIQRFLLDQPVLARPPSALNQLRKFSRRNRGLVAGLVVAFTVLLLGLIVTAVLLSRTSRLLEERDQEVAASQEAIGFLEGIFAQTDPLEEGDVKLSDLASRAADAFEGQLLERPVPRARLLNSIGKTLLDVGQPSRAEPLLEEALQIRAKSFGKESLQYAQTLERVARVHQVDGRHESAYRMQRDVLEIRRAKLGRAELVADALANLANSAGFLGRHDEAEEHKREAVAMALDLFGPEDPRALRHRAGLASTLVYSGRVVEAFPLMEELLSVRDSLSPHTEIQLLVDRGWALRFEGRLEESLETLEEARALVVERYGEEIGILRGVDSSRAMALAGLGRASEAVPILKDVLERTIEVDGPDSMATATATHDLAYVVHDLPSPGSGEALGLYREAITRFRRVSGGDSGFSYMAQHNLALWFESQNRLVEALVEITAAYEGRLRLLGMDDSNTLASLRGLAGVLATMSRHGDAATRYAEFVSHSAPLFGQAAFPVQTARLQLSASYARSGDLERARAALAEARSHLSAMHDPEAFRGRIQRTENVIAAEEGR